MYATQVKYHDETTQPFMPYRVTQAAHSRNNVQHKQPQPANHGVIQRI